MFLYKESLSSHHFCNISHSIPMLTRTFPPPLAFSNPIAPFRNFQLSDLFFKILSGYTPLSMSDLYLEVEKDDGVM